MNVCLREAAAAADKGAAASASAGTEAAAAAAAAAVTRLPQKRRRLELWGVCSKATAAAVGDEGQERGRGRADKFLQVVCGKL